MYWDFNGETKIKTKFCRQISVPNSLILGLFSVAVLAAKIR